MYVCIYIYICPYIGIHPHTSVHIDTYITLLHRLALVIEGNQIRIGFHSLGQHIDNGRTSAGRFRPQVICCTCTDGRCENEHLNISYKWSCEVLVEAPTGRLTEIHLVS